MDFSKSVELMYEKPVNCSSDDSGGDPYSFFPTFDLSKRSNSRSVAPASSWDHHSANEIGSNQYDDIYDAADKAGQDYVSFQKG